MTQHHNTVTRREWMERAAYAWSALSAAPLLARCVSDVAVPKSEGLTNADDTAPLQLGMLLYPGFTMLDLTGPQSALGPLGVTHLVSKDLVPVPSDSGMSLVPTTTYEACPTQLDVLFVPGGFGTADAMLDRAALQFLRDRAPTSRYVTSVCSGALVLAAAGLLNGYRAATHWATREALAMFDVEVLEERVVIDRNRMTGGGVTAGIDFGLVLASQLRGEAIAQRQQLLMEYNPQPPFDSGAPERATPEVLEAARTLLQPSGVQILEATTTAIARLG
jgi:cyclohexyl-isocyanide hydratase